MGTGKADFIKIPHLLEGERGWEREGDRGKEEKKKKDKQGWTKQNSSPVLE